MFQGLVAHGSEAEVAHGKTFSYPRPNPAPLWQVPLGKSWDGRPELGISGNDCGKVNDLVGPNNMVENSQLWKIYDVTLRKYIDRFYSRSYPHVFLVLVWILHKKDQLVNINWILLRVIQPKSFKMTTKIWAPMKWAEFLRLPKIGCSLVPLNPFGINIFHNRSRAALLLLPPL